jgi:hypothetical protein
MRSKSQDPVQILEEVKDSVTCLLVTDHEIIIGSADGRVRIGVKIFGMATYDLGYSTLES